MAAINDLAISQVVAGAFLLGLQLEGADGQTQLLNNHIILLLFLGEGLFTLGLVLGAFH